MKEKSEKQIKSAFEKAKTYFANGKYEKTLDILYNFNSYAFRRAFDYIDRKESYILRASAHFKLEDYADVYDSIARFLVIPHNNNLLTRLSGFLSHSEIHSFLKNEISNEENRIIKKDKINKFLTFVEKVEDEAEKGRLLSILYQLNNAYFENEITEYLHYLLSELIQKYPDYESLKTELNEAQKNLERLELERASRVSREREQEKARLEHFRKKEKVPQENILGITPMDAYDAMQTMIKMGELIEITEAYLNSDNKEEILLKIQEKAKTFVNEEKIFLDLILNLPDKTRSIQILDRYAKAHGSTDTMKEINEIYLILSKEYPNNMLLKQLLKDFKPFV